MTCPESRKRAPTQQWARPKTTPSEPRIDRLALQSEHAEDAFVHPPQRFAFDEAMQRFQAERELAQGERPASRSILGSADVRGAVVAQCIPGRR